MGPIDPIRPVRLVKRERSTAEADTPPQPTINVTVNVASPAPPPANPYQPPTGVDAHLIAQTARTRGLRGGQQVLDTARSTYLENEYSGPNDRRARAGRITKTEA
ncbi:MAG TPA: hypothetical protein VHS81_00090 [Caulobacteraceae bacterium]|jgi:hypothetical protein|nr:hypothetical protein [Caulobacteraceae bacterium]